MVIELCVVQFWSEIILVISNRTRAARSSDFEITRMISDQIALHSVQLPLFIIVIIIIKTVLLLKRRNDRRSERNLCNCGKKPAKKSRTSTGFEPVTSRYQCDVLPTEL